MNTMRSTGRKRVLRNSTAQIRTRLEWSSHAKRKRKRHRFIGFLRYTDNLPHQAKATLSDFAFQLAGRRAFLFLRVNSYLSLFLAILPFISVFYRLFGSFGLSTKGPYTINRCALSSHVVGISICAHFSLAQS